MHVGYQYRHDFSNLLWAYISGLHVNQNLLGTANKRSREATYRRNNKRNLKLKNIRKNYTLTREISPIW